MSNKKRRLPFVQLDVFTSVPLEGNQLAVFADGRDLSDAEMQAVAKEMNLSETAFILPRDAATERERGVRVRIFTVDEELPFAGHPTLGTAMALRNDALRGNIGAEEVALELNMGRIPVRFSTRDGLPFGVMTQRDPEFGRSTRVKTWRAPPDSRSVTLPTICRYRPSPRATRLRLFH